jgi:plasmid stability protein
MSITLTLESVPQEVFERLEALARRHRRSLNNEAIVCLESALLPGRMPPAERLERARALRASLSQESFPAQDFDALKREGRP